MNKLTHLDLSNNNISDIFSLRYLHNLEFLNLGANNIEDVPYWLINFKKLNIAFNKIYYSGYGDDMIKEEILYLYENPIKNIPTKYLNMGEEDDFEKIATFFEDRKFTHDIPRTEEYAFFQKLDKDIEKAFIEILTTISKYEDEDNFNKLLSLLLPQHGYKVDYQSRVKRKTADLKITNKDGNFVSYIEAFILKTLDRNNIHDHISRLIEDYDISGNLVNYIIVYSESNNYKDLWSKYKVFLSKEINSFKNGLKFPIKKNINDKSNETSKADFFLTETAHNRNNKTVYIRHFFIDISDKIKIKKPYH